MRPFLFDVVLLFASSYGFPATSETSSSATRFNVGVSHSFNHLDVASQKIENQPSISKSRLTSVSNRKSSGLEALDNNSIHQRGAVANQIQVIPLSLETDFPDSGRKAAVQEGEGFLSKIDSIYGYIQQMVANIFNHKPVVDTIQQSDKYGNVGDQSKAVGLIFVNTFDGFTNMLNNVVEVPFAIIKQIGEKASSALTKAGRLVGI